MSSDSNDKSQNTMITHSTLHGHIHTFDGDHRHIHGHIHKHRHSLPSHIDASSLIRLDPQLGITNINQKSPQAPTDTLAATHPSNNILENSNLEKGTSFDLTHCQIQQIIDQCFHNSLDNCFDCSNSVEEILNNEGLHLRQPSEKISARLELSNKASGKDTFSPGSYGSSDSTQLSLSSPQSQVNSVGSPIEIKNQLQSLFDYEVDCFEPNCIANEATQEGDKCFEFCDFEKLPNEIKLEKGLKLEDLVTDIPDSYTSLRPVNSSKLSDIRTETSKSIGKNHKHIHAHKILHHCLDDPHKEESKSCKKRKLPLSKVEQFHYNWIDLNNTPLELPGFKPEAVGHKDHLHCLWSNCPSNLTKFSTNEDLRSHILKDHILRDKVPTHGAIDDLCKMLQSPVQNSKSLFECEWLDCDFKSDDIIKMLEHIPSDHGFRKNKKSQSHAKVEELGDSEILKLHHSNEIEPSGADEEDFDDNHTCKWEDADGIICNMEFESTEDLTTHLVDDHIGGGHPTYICKWENCSRNHKLFNQRQKIIRHLHVHTKHRPCVCKICGKRFAIDLMLEQHMRTHTGERPFQCSICAKWFKTSSSLSVHRRVHSGEKPLVCKYPGCNKRFNESSNLTKHFKVHEKPFKCHQCIKTFNQERQLVNHWRWHHGVVEDVVIEKWKLDNNRSKDLSFNDYNRSTTTDVLNSG